MRKFLVLLTCGLLLLSCNNGNKQLPLTDDWELTFEQDLETLQLFLPYEEGNKLILTDTKSDSTMNFAVTSKEMKYSMGGAKYNFFAHYEEIYETEDDLFVTFESNDMVLKVMLSTVYGDNSSIRKSTAECACFKPLNGAGHTRFIISEKVNVLPDTVCLKDLDKEYIIYLVKNQGIIRIEQYLPADSKGDFTELIHCWENNL